MSTSQKHWKMLMNEFIPQQNTTPLQALTRVVTTKGEQQLVRTPRDEFHRFRKIYKGVQKSQKNKDTRKGNN